MQTYSSVFHPRFSYPIFWLSFTGNISKVLSVFTLSTPHTIFFPQPEPAQGSVSAHFFQWKQPYQSSAMALYAARSNSYFSVLGLHPFLVTSNKIDQFPFFETSSWILRQHILFTSYTQTALFQLLCWLSSFAQLYSLVGSRVLL